MIHTITIWNFFSQWPPHREIKWQQLKAKGELAHVLTDAEITRLFLWGRDILKHDNRRMYWHQHKHRSGGHSCWGAVPRWTVCCRQRARTHTLSHSCSNNKLPFMCTCTNEAQPVNYSQLRRDMAADRYPTRAAVSHPVVVAIQPQRHAPPLIIPPNSTAPLH